LNQQDSQPGAQLGNISVYDRVIRHRRQRGGHGFTSRVPAMVVRVTGARVVIDCHHAHGEVQRRTVLAASLSKAPVAPEGGAV
jgi:hypothetical protein